MSNRVIWFIALALVMGLAQVSPAAWDPNTDPALTGWWKFDEGSGTTAKDSSGKGNDGTLNGAVTWVPGWRGTGVEFDGTSGYVGTGKSLLNNAVDFTMCGWVKSQNSNASRIGLFGQNDLIEMGFMNGNAEVWTAVAGTVNTPWRFNNATEWHHIAVVDSGTSMMIYIDGVLANTGSGGTHTTSTFFFNIGGGGVWDPSGNWFDGQIDDVRLYLRGLTAQEVKSLIPLKVKAYSPSPANGATGVMMPLFTWTPGELSLFENVYLGTTPDLTAANLVSNHQSIMLKMYYHVVPPLVPGQKYYWRVDGIDAAGHVFTGDVWSCTMMPVAAWTPVPANGAQYQVTDVNLAWTPGQNANKHDVYFGTSQDDVANGAASVSKGTVSVPMLDPGPLTPATTYYWRVDETSLMGQKTAGEVWSFTTRPAIAKTANLMGWWKLEDENSGTAVDYSGWDRDGTLMGNPQWVDGYQGGAMEFDGTDDYVDTHYTDNLASWTVCTWVTSPAAPAATSPTGPVHREMNYQINWNHGTDTFRGAAAMDVGGTWYAASFGNLSGGTWYHLAATYDDTGLKTYVNGELITTNAVPKGPADAESNSLKFARHAAAAQFFAGTVDDVRVYDRALTQDEIKETMRGDPLLAWDPHPMAGVTADIRDVATLTWEAGQTAAKHDVYLGKDKAAVKNADTSSPEYMGRQAGTSYATAGEVEFGGGAYFWRIDEVEADGTTVHKGSVWSFTVPDFLLIDDFESYTNASPNRLFQTWIDGWGFSEDEFFPSGNPGNGTGATVGHDIWTAGTPYTNIVETSTVRPGSKQSMPLDYDNSNNPYNSEAERTWASPQDFTASGVSVLSLQVYGYPVMTTTTVTETGGKMSLTGSGADIWGTSDQFTFAYKTLNGDGSIIAKVVSNGTGTQTWAKGGVMIRDSLTGNSAHAMQVMTGSAGNGGAFQNRATAGLDQNANDATSNVTAASVIAPPYWVKIDRFGNTLTGYISTDGVSWVAPNSADVEMTDPVYIGLCVTSHAAAESRTFQFEGIKTTGNVTGQWQGAIIDSPKYNSPQDFYVFLQDSQGKNAVVSNATAVTSGDWLDVQMPLSQFTGVNMTKIKKMIIGIGSHANPAADGSGSLFIDDIRVIKPTP
jgi:hypothetical protein